MYSVLNTKKYMKRCFELATKSNNKVRNNPMVGSIIVYNNRIIGEGWHQEYGKGHAEVNAFHSVKKEDEKYLPESTIYVNLEPCFHFGKTPPCVQLILEKKIKRVVVSCLDPNPKVAGQSIALLQEKGVEVETNILGKEGQFLIRRFLTNQELKRPYIILKYAQSQDGFIGKENESIWLTGKLSKTLVHKWRSEESATLIGTKTALVDNPQLTNRLYGNQQGTRIIIDKDNSLPKNLHIFDASIKTIIINNKISINKENSLLIHKKINFKNQFFSELFQVLLSEKIKSVIIEGGAKTLQSFIDAGYWDEARIFTAPKLLKAGIESPQGVKNFPHQSYSIGDDQLDIHYKTKYYQHWKQDLSI